jgi:hypothetical protein
VLDTSEAPPVSDCGLITSGSWDAKALLLAGSVSDHRHLHAEQPQRMFIKKTSTSPMLIAHFFVFCVLFAGVHHSSLRSRSP